MVGKPGPEAAFTIAALVYYFFRKIATRLHTTGGGFTFGAGSLPGVLTI